jgi:hypothetical protein
MQEANTLNNSKHLFKIKCAESNDEFKLYGRPCELSAFSFVPQTREYEPSERSIYNYKTTRQNDALKLDYDRLFRVNYDYNNKVHRCDRKHAKLNGLDAWSEEITKEIPSKSSHEFGKRLINLDVLTSSSASSTNRAATARDFNYAVKLLDPPERKHVRIAKVKSEFYNRNGINDLTKKDILSNF